MSESHRKKIEEAARKYQDENDTPYMTDFIAGAEFALKMVDCTRCYNDGYFQGCKDTKIFDENVCVSKSAPSLEPRDHP